MTDNPVLHGITIWYLLYTTVLLLYIYIYIYIYYTYSGVKKCWPPSWFFIFLQVCHTLMFQIIKQIEILIKDNTSKHNMQFLNEVFYYEEMTKSKPAWPCVKKCLPPKPNNWLGHPYQQQLQSSVCDNLQWVCYSAVEEFWPTHLGRIVVIQPHWRVFEHEPPF